jgi:rhodanese-related sulfurtransferase
MNWWFWPLLVGSILYILYQQWWLRRGIPQASVHDLKGMIDTRQKYFLVDVREPIEFGGGHIPQAVNVPLGALQQQAAGWNRDRQIYVVCASGRRSVVACRRLLGMGFTQVANVDGGMRRWPWGTV